MSIPPSTSELPGRSIAATAVLSSTSAVASLSSPSPSRMVTTRGGRPSRLPSAVAATASGGATTAPSASATAKPITGHSDCSTSATTSALTATSTTER